MFPPVHFLTRRKASRTTANIGNRNGSVNLRKKPKKSACGLFVGSPLLEFSTTRKLVNARTL
jgi:hypothetical protein